MLWNWEHNGDRLIQIILIGQPELRHKLQEPRWEPLKQRIVLSYHLRNLSSEEVTAYIRHRIDVEFLEGDVVPDAAGAAAGV